MMSELILKRETFCLQLKRTEKERIFKGKRQTFYSKEQLLELIKKKDQDSINKLIQISEGSRQQIMELIELGGIQYFSNLLSSSDKDLSIIGLTNLYSLNSVQVSRQDLFLFETIMNQVHQYQNIEQLIKRLRFLNVITLYYTDISYLEEEQRIKEKLYYILIYTNKNINKFSKFRKSASRDFYLQQQYNLFKMKLYKYVVIILIKVLIKLLFNYFTIINLIFIYNILILYSFKYQQKIIIRNPKNPQIKFDLLSKQVYYYENTLLMIMQSLLLF